MKFVIVPENSELSFEISITCPWFLNLKLNSSEDFSKFFKSNVFCNSIFLLYQKTVSPLISFVWENVVWNEIKRVMKLCKVFS